MYGSVYLLHEAWDGQHSNRIQSAIDRILARGASRTVVDWREVRVSPRSVRGDTQPEVISQTACAEIREQQGQIGEIDPAVVVDITHWTGGHR